LLDQPNDGSYVAFLPGFESSPFRPEFNGAILNGSAGLHS